MKKILPVFCFYIFIFLYAGAQQNEPKKFSGNPVIEGWYADPEAAIFKKQYWLYPTFSDKYVKQVFLDAFSSWDMVNWQKHSHVLDTLNVKWANKAVWAPSVIEKDNKYFLFFSANDIQSDNETGGIGVAVADNPAGPFKDYLGKPLIDKFYNGAQPIDQFVFKDGNGKYYMIYGGWRHCNIAQLKSDFTGFIPFDDGKIFKEITPENYVEGPMMFLYNKKYYFMWSEGGWGEPDYSVAYAIADSPLGPFARVSKILQQDETVATSAGHHSIFYNTKKNKWFITYHRRPLGDKVANHRITCIDEIFFDKKGFILPVKMTFKGVPALRN